MFILNSRTIINIILLICKVVSGLVLGLTMAIIIQTLTNCSTLSFVFIVLSIGLAFIKLTWSYRFKGLVVVNLFFITLFLLFKLYVSISAI